MTITAHDIHLHTKKVVETVELVCMWRWATFLKNCQNELSVIKRLIMNKAKARRHGPKLLFQTIKKTYSRGRRSTGLIMVGAINRWKTACKCTQQKWKNNCKTIITINVQSVPNKSERTIVKQLSRSTCRVSIIINGFISRDCFNLTPKNPVMTNHHVYRYVLGPFHPVPDSIGTRYLP